MPSLHPMGSNGARVNIDHLIPIQVLEGFYSPMMHEKQQEIERLSQIVRETKKEKFKYNRQVKLLSL